MFRSVVRAAVQSPQVERVIKAAPNAAGAAQRFVAGERVEELIPRAFDLVGQGLAVSIGWLSGVALEPQRASATRDELLLLLTTLAEAELTPSAEVSVGLGQLGHGLDPEAALEHLRSICAAASTAGTTITLDAEDDTSTDALLDLASRLREDFPTTGVTVQANLRRSEVDCRELADPGSRVRLCKGDRSEPESVAFTSALDIDRSFVRCLNALMSGSGYPMVATHDQRLLAIAEDRAKWFDRTPDEFEFQFLYGIRQDEARRLAAAGYTVRVYLPYGPDWYPYVARRLAEHPANLRALLRRGRAERRSDER